MADLTDESELTRALAPVFANRVFVHPGAVTRISFGEVLDAGTDSFGVAPPTYRVAVAIPADTALRLADLIIAKLRPKPGESS